MTILVTGGAGYIGSVTAERLTTKGESIVILDDLSYGHREAIDADIPFYQGSAGDRCLLAHVVKEHGIDSCMHFAASAFVAESVEQPALYFENNVQQGISLLNALVDAGVRRFIFSSSCTVYGEVTRVPIGEDSPLWPKNPYGWTKFTLERILETYDTAYGLKSVCLRYLEHLRRAGASAALNLGTGRGYSVLEVVESARRVTGVPIRTRIEGPRPGDPAQLVADPSRAKALLKWHPTMSELDAIVESAWAWKKKQPRGYGSRAVAK